MAENTTISWSDHTWSPWYGCTQVSMGDQGACVGCYARHLSETRMGRVVFGGPGRGQGTRDVRADSAWKLPLRWEREAAAAERAWFAPEGAPDGGIGKPWPYSPFVFPSMCDPFDNHPDLVEPRRRFFDLIRATPHLTWLLLTKRPQNIAKLFVETITPELRREYQATRRLGVSLWPTNAAIGCTVVTQEEADRDVPVLLAAKAGLKPAFAFLSMEPLLGPVDLRRLRRDERTWLDGLTGYWTVGASMAGGFAKAQEAIASLPPLPPALPCLDWVITGGETDQGAHKARPSHPDWFRDLRDQCAAAGVAYHHKQNGEWAPGECGSTPPTRSEATADWFNEAWSFGSLTPRESQELHVDDEPTVFRLGKGRSGRTLDGVVHDARPEVR